MSDYNAETLNSLPHRGFTDLRGVGLAPTGKRRLVTAHTQSRRRTADKLTARVVTGSFRW